MIIKIKNKDKKWKFKGYIPELSDLNARSDSLEYFFNLSDKTPDLYFTDYDIFNGAFLRGIRWAIDKYGIDAKHLPGHMK